MTYKYCVAECWGKGFITHSDASKFQVSGFSGNVWRYNCRGVVYRALRQGIC